MTVRLLIVDDHAIVRDGLRGLFTGADGYLVVGEAGDGEEAIAVARRTRPDVVLMDLRMPRLGGAEAIRRLRREAPDIRVLVLTTYDTDEDVLPAIEAGATGYLLKDASRPELLRALEATVRGRAVLAPAAAELLMSRVRAAADGALSRRELEVLTLTARGATNRETAAELFITVATVKTHLQHIYAKLGVTDRTEAVAVAYERGLLRGGQDR
ncbi:response regulator transcription factor [Streptomyces sp. DSM 44915]|uniref:Response regulator transcription factor n=1 Tax=Streptomyces chisholmiae TaxID=3075540 RepID=A0ABU2JSS1_9ACTN|nr:response regulator transcription factor [Streptomyces sp. DSM 44915]MDT0268036.1 response regulator transcription factor [Streptomyces sp. DSM 44915]